jgi:hypothetical protein
LTGVVRGALSEVVDKAKRQTSQEKKQLKQHQMIEPIIWYLRTDHRMGAVT